MKLTEEIIKDIIKEIILMEAANLSAEAEYAIDQLMGIQLVLNTGIAEAEKNSKTQKYYKKYKSEIDKLKKKMLQEFPDEEEY